MADQLFTKRLPVVFKYGDREDRRSSVNIRMEIQLTASTLSRKELFVSLTDDKDLFFLYTLRLNEECFQSLKVQQGLLVDFGAFPQKFIDLLEMCLKEEHKEVPKFVLHFVTQNSLAGERAVAILNVVETNPFKHLTHLSLKFVPGTDADVKSYLADCLKQLKETNSTLHQRLEHTNNTLSSQLHTTQETLASRTAELDRLRAEWSSSMNNVSSKHKEEMALEKEKSIQMQSSYQQKFERDRRELEQAHTKIVKQLESRIFEIEGINKDLTDKKYKSESLIRELKAKLSGIEEEHVRAKQEIQSLRKQNNTLDSDNHEKEKLINQYKTRIAVFEQELKDKEQVISKSSDLLDSEQERQRKIDEDLERRCKEISKLENKVKAMSEELKKGNEIIKKLQGEIKNYHAKVKLRSQIATEQEKLLGEKDQELEKLRQDLASTKDTLKLKEEGCQKLSENLESTTQKLEESRQLLKTNENVIQWLNKQINEQQINHHRVGTFEMPSVTANHRPGGNVVHNYSSSSYGSNHQHGDSHLPNTNVMIPRPIPNQHRQPQVQYGGGGIRRSAIPTTTSYRQQAPPPPIPEEIRPGSFNASPASTTQTSDKENNPPIDLKYLQKRDDAIPVRGLLNRSNSPPPISSPNLTPPVTSGVSNRIPQQLIIPKTNTPPLASAYFGQLKPS
ncbi:hypothetical protein SNE40_004963 [Patella caerulea]|uniref:Spindle assembly abnormal protein 6 homolog n=1 Tax=Patella caerulea TaxID=87958 RepID=A0AAN8QD38_PATCE